MNQINPKGRTRKVKRNTKENNDRNMNDKKINRTNKTDRTNRTDEIKNLSKVITAHGTQGDIIRVGIEIDITKINKIKQIDITELQNRIKKAITSEIFDTLNIKMNSNNKQNNKLIDVIIFTEFLPSYNR